MNDPLPCPFCGEVEVELQQGTTDREGTPVNVMCSGCGATGPFVYAPHGTDQLSMFALAVEPWNDRAQSTAWQLPFHLLNRPQ